MTVKYKMQMSKLKKSTDKLCLLWKSYVKGFSATSEQSAFPHIEGNIPTSKLSLMPYITVGLVLGRRFWILVKRFHPYWDFIQILIVIYFK